ncbi:MAG: 3-phosphoshikimate 1-carboxyvinyltransferase [Lachnospiraceae bacterium]|nr:3-phosphoshikimate 1-carboxyvinyltransferase [Lachnospiraceae bacterium]
MKQFAMKPFREPPHIRVSVPGSKSITNRALMLAALAEGKSVLKGVLFSDDSRVFMEALETLGYEIEVKEDKKEVAITGCGGKIPRDNVSVYVGSAGTAARFLTAMLALSGGCYEVEASEQMKKRPMRPLLEALEQMGVNFEYKEESYAFPFRICGKKETASEEKVLLNIDESSQFLSALLLTGVLCKSERSILLTGKRDAKAYVRISMKMMEEFGGQMRQLGENEYKLLPEYKYQGREYRIEPDVSAACYFYAMAAINGGTAVVNHVHFDSTQGDIQFLRVLEQMGCRVAEEKEGICVTGPKEGNLHGIKVNMSDFSDQTMTLAAVAVFADTTTEISGVEHIRRQESDRMEGIVRELRGRGISCEAEGGSILIRPGHLTPGVMRTYEDHRMAMAFSVIGTKVPGIIIDNPLCCRKTFENYFNILTNLDLSLE